MTYNFDSVPEAVIRLGFTNGVCSQCDKLATVEKLRRNYPRSGGHELWCDDCYEALPREVVCFYADDRPSEVAYRDLSLADAQDICSDPSTRGDDWFYGFRIQEA